MPARVVVIGGGIAGVSVAFHLARSGAEVTLVEQESTLAFHSTGRSAALYFENYGADANRPLTRASRTFFEGPPPGLIDHPLLAERGALWIGRPDQDASLSAILEDGAREGGSARWLEPEEAVALVPVLRPEMVGGGVWEPEALDMDVAAIHQGFVRGLRAAGATVVTSFRVSVLERTGVRWKVGDQRRELEADVIVNAAGSWCDLIGAKAGAMTIGLQPLRRTAFTVPGNEAWAKWPLVSNADNEFYFRPDGAQLLCSLAEENPTDPCDARPEQLDIALAIDRINTHTTIDIRTVRSSWTGLRSFVGDRAMVIGFDPVAPQFFWLAGQGGTGIQTAPAAGELAASLITTGRSPQRLLDFGVDVEALSPTRLPSQPR
jgi:D-arginine dehydrogenase